MMPLITKHLPCSIHLHAQWLRADVCPYETQVPLINLFPVQHAPELLHIFLLPPHSVVEEPAVLVYADTEQGVDPFAQLTEAPRGRVKRLPYVVLVKQGTRAVVDVDALRRVQRSHGRGGMQWCRAL